MAHHAARDSVNEEDHEGRFLEVAIAGLLNAHREEIAIDVPDEGHNQRSSGAIRGDPTYLWREVIREAIREVIKEAIRRTCGGRSSGRQSERSSRRRSDVLVEGGHQGGNQRGHQGGDPTYLWRTERSPSTRTGECTAASTGKAARLTCGETERRGEHHLHACTAASTG
jgi:hypothetical protein